MTGSELSELSELSEESEKLENSEHSEYSEHSENSEGWVNCVNFAFKTEGMEKIKIAIVNGANLNLTGERFPEIYGKESFGDYLEQMKRGHPEFEILYSQSNSEGEIIDTLQRLRADSGIAGIIINPGAYAHYSYAIADALADISKPKVEVHLSNIMSREAHRRVSVTAAHCDALIAGAGINGYTLAAMLIQKKCLIKK